MVAKKRRPAALAVGGAGQGNVGAACGATDAAAGHGRRRPRVFTHEAAERYTAAPGRPGRDGECVARSGCAYDAEIES